MDTNIKISIAIDNDCWGPERVAISDENETGIDLALLADEAIRKAVLERLILDFNKRLRKTLLRFEKEVEERIAAIERETPAEKEG